MTETVTALDVLALADWERATKTKLIIARPLCTMLLDESVASQFMIKTLEGAQAIQANSIVCIGIGNDIWQQSKTSLLKNYTVTDFTTDGWMICTPKPENVREVLEVTEDLCQTGKFRIKAKWGTPEGDTFFQVGKVGDYIARDVDDHTDTWIVAREMFLNTYETEKENEIRKQQNAPVANVLPFCKKAA